MEDEQKEVKAYVKNASDPKQIKEAAIKERFDDKSAVEDMKSVLSTIQGRRVLWRLLKECQVLRSLMDESPYWAYYKIGKHDIGVVIFESIVDADEGAYLKMMTENKK